MLIHCRIIKVKFSRLNLSQNLLYTQKSPQNEDKITSLTFGELTNTSLYQHHLFLNV